MNKTTLHIIGSSPHASAALADCLKLLKPGDALLLLEAGVHAVHGEQVWQRQLTATTEFHKIHILAEDAALRGVQVMPPFDLVDYQGMVSLAVEHDNSMSWY